MTGPRPVRLPYRQDCRAYYALVRHLPWPVWLDSGFPVSGGGRFDIVAADPYRMLTVGGDDADAGTVPAGKDPFVAVREALGPRTDQAADLPFGGGAIGFLGYDLARTLGDLPARRGTGGWPDMAVGLYDWAVVVDHARRRSWFVRQGRDGRQEQAWRSVLPQLETVPDLASAPDAVSGSLIDEGMDPATYARQFQRIQRYIHDGDCYQVNFARRLRARVVQDAWTLYQRMRAHNPAPYGALLEYPFGQVLSASPEQFLALHGGEVQTRPIKGTRPRGGDAAADLALRAELLASAKDRAENLMIVDLLRNDLGKVCEPGSIAVPALFRIESFATVHHLVSTVTGRLRPAHDALDLIAACFPGGSITGAPKRRAMQIIDELEPVRREVYCGSIFRLGFDGNLDSSICIRTALLRGDELFYWTGGGIVADSDCDAEYQETRDKAAAFLRLLGDADG